MEEDTLFIQLTNLQNRMNIADSAESNTQLITALNGILADTVSVSHEVQGFHWNVKGPDFAEYHALFGEIYSSISSRIDDIAESILRLGYDAPFHLSDFMKLRTIGESAVIDTPESMSNELLSGIGALIENVNNGFDIATELRQQGIANLLGEIIFDLQKWSWQLRASIGAQLPNKLI